MNATDTGLPQKAAPDSGMPTVSAAGSGVELSRALTFRAALKMKAAISENTRDAVIPTAAAVIGPKVRRASRAHRPPHGLRSI